MKKNTLLRHLLMGSTLAAAIGSAGAQTTYQWSGTTNTTFGTSTNWSTGSGLTAGPAASSGTSNSRLNVQNGLTNPLTYTATQGTTIYSGATLRALVIGSTTNGSMIITGGTFDSRQTGGADIVGHQGGTGSLTIDGGNYINTSGNTIFQLGLAGDNTVGNLTINSGTFTGRELRFGAANNLLTGTLILNGGITTLTTMQEWDQVNGSSGVTSNVNFNGGILRAGAAGTLITPGITNAVVQSNGAIIDTNTFNTTIAKSLTAGTGSGGLTKQGAGTLTLSAANTYTGATTVSTGTLALSAGGLIANSSTINVASAATLSVTGVTPTTFTVGATQTLTGAGTILATGKTVVANGTLSPGNSPGTLTQDGGALRLGLNGDLNWQVHNAAGTAGIGYDTVNLINGATLDLSLLSAANSYNINLWSLSGISPDVNGNATGFDNTLNYSWTLFSTGTAITGFDASDFAINTGAFNGTSGFSNALGGGAFSVNLADGNTDLVLSFTAIPEPSAALLGGLGMLLLLRRRR